MTDRKSDQLSNFGLYDELDEYGNDKRLPPSLQREFQYDPNILTVQLVRLQRFIHDHHQTVEYYIDKTVDGVFYAERQTTRTFRWCKEEVPGLVWPTTQVATMSGLAYFANRGGPVLHRLGATSALGLMTGFLVYPGWRRETRRIFDKQVVEPLPSVREAIQLGHEAYRKMLFGVTYVWSTYDDAVSTVYKSYRKTRFRIISFFKPGSRPDQ